MVCSADTLKVDFTAPKEEKGKRQTWWRARPYHYSECTTFNDVDLFSNKTNLNPKIKDKPILPREEERLQLLPIVLLAWVCW